MLYFFAGAVFACLVAFFDLIIPRLIQYTVDAVIGGDLSSIPVWAAGMIARLGGASFLRQNLWLSAAAVAAAALAGALCRYAFKMSNEKGSELFLRRTRNELFREQGMNCSGRSFPFPIPGWERTAREISSSAAHRMSRPSGYLSPSSSHPFCMSLSLSLCLFIL